jgi:hypothetical protein
MGLIATFLPLLDNGEIYKTQSLSPLTLRLTAHYPFGKIDEPSEKLLFIWKMGWCECGVAIDCLPHHVY